MNERSFYFILLWSMLGLAALVFPVLLFIAAPYGRHAPRRGPTLPARLGWLLMESPSALVPVICFALSPPTTIAPWILLAAFELHYVHRTFIYPFRLRPGTRPMPVVVFSSAFAFTMANGYLVGRWLARFGDYRGFATDPRLFIGLALFLVGYAINQHADWVLLHLRAPGETGYKIPRGGLYRFVSCPNYLGEILEWSGFAIASWSLPGLVFAVWTFANLAPRALAHHRWYRNTFPDYPPERRALLPLLL